MSIGGDLTKLRANVAVLGLYFILPIILLVVLVIKIFSGLSSLLGCKSHKNVAGEVAVVSNITYTELCKSSKFWTSQKLKFARA